MPQPSTILAALNMAARINPYGNALNADARDAAKRASARMQGWPLARVAWQLERTAMGDGFHEEALKHAASLPGLADDERALIRRYTEGTQGGTDHVALQTLALKLDSIAAAEPAERPMHDNLTTARAVAQELLDVLLQCEAPRRLKLRACNAVDAARALLEGQPEAAAKMLPGVQPASLTDTQHEAVANADAHTSNAGLPTYSDLIALLQEAQNGISDHEFSRPGGWAQRAKAATASHAPPQGRQGWDVCARQSAGRLIDDLMRANREASPLESLLLLPLLAQARGICGQLRAIATAIDQTPEN